MFILEVVIVSWKLINFVINISLNVMLYIFLSIGKNIFFFLVLKILDYLLEML